MTRRMTLRVIAYLVAVPLVAMLLMFVSRAAAQQTSSKEASTGLRINGAVANPQQWTAGQLRKQFAGQIVAVAYTTRGQNVQSHCVPLLTLLKAAGADTELKMAPNVEPSKKNHPLRLVLLAVGHDGYTAAFALAEILPDVGGHELWVALDIDGEAFPEGEGHLRLIAPADPKPARWVRDLSSVQVIDTARSLDARKS